MALEGSIRDFGLTDIFQLIAIQKKSGLLELTSDLDNIGIYFHDGQIVRVKALKKDESILLGQLLVRSGRITAEQLRKALEIQRETMQKLGYILSANNFLSEKDLRETLHYQMLETAYKVFRWNRGHYKFSQEVVTFDPALTIPIDPEHVLMDGIRMIDEWPMIESKIRTFDAVYARVEGIEERLKRPSRAPIDKVEAEFKAIVSRLEPKEKTEDLSEIEEEIEAPVSRTGLTEEEEIVLSLVDGRRDVHEIIDASRLGEFGACKALAGLLDKRFIQEMGRKSRPQEGKPSRRLEWLSIFGNAAFYGVLGVGLALTLLVWFVRMGGIPSLFGSGSDGTILPHAAMNRLDVLRFLAETHELRTGRPPSGVEDLVKAGLARRADSFDPWGRAIRIEPAGAGGIVLRSVGPDGTADTPDDIVLSGRTRRGPKSEEPGGGSANLPLDKGGPVKDNPPPPNTEERKP